MTFRDDLLPVLDAVRVIPGALGLRTDRVFAVVRTWSGTDVGLGTVTETRTEITPIPRVFETMLGRVLTVYPVSPLIAISIINPTVTANTERVFEVEGPNAGRYVLNDFSVAGPFRYKLILHRLDTRHPLPDALPVLP